MVFCFCSKLSRWQFSCSVPSHTCMFSGLHSSAFSSTNLFTFGDRSFRLPWTTLMPLRWRCRPTCGCASCLAKRPTSPENLKNMFFKILPFGLLETTQLCGCYEFGHGFGGVWYSLCGRTGGFVRYRWISLRKATGSTCAYLGKLL